ncbi:hypothetical protein FSG65_023115, partial [Escherichia coli]|nr:hypothetical protein [Escherichia coli]
CIHLNLMIFTKIIRGFISPPHLERVGDNAWMGKKYGRLNKDAWRDDLRQRFKEAFRVLRPHGVLIF